jgi:hypothetical protein
VASPPIPPSLEHLGNRPFSFYPAISGIEHNEWLYRRASWSEVLVVNTQNGMELWIPRRFVGELSTTDSPVSIMGLTRELQYKSGMIYPCRRQVLTMPVAGSAEATGAGAERVNPASVLGIRLESSTDRRMLRLVGGAMAVALAACLVVVSLTRVGVVRQRVVFTAKDQSYLELTARDDYLGVVNKLGKPAQERDAEIGTIQYRALVYPSRRYTVILMGGELNGARFVGIVDQNWHAVYSTNSATMALLRGLKKF